MNNKNNLNFVSSACYQIGNRKLTTKVVKQLERANTAFVISFGDYFEREAGENIRPNELYNINMNDYGN